MGPEAPKAEQQEEISLRFEMQEKIFEVDDMLQRLPDTPDRQMLKHVLSAASDIIHSGNEKRHWGHGARQLRVELEGALRELRHLEDESV